jgi:hypothetical protein
VTYGYVDRNDIDQITNLLEIWQAGILLYAEDQLDAIKEALVHFQQENDTKTSVIVFMTYTLDQVCSVITASLLIRTGITVTVFY